MLCGRQVLVDGAAVRNEAEAELEVTGQPAVRSQRQDQQWSDQQEAHHQEGHTAPIAEQVRAVSRGTVRPHLREEGSVWSANTNGHKGSQSDSNVDICLMDYITKSKDFST